MIFYDDISFNFKMKTFVILFCDVIQLLHFLINFKTSNQSQTPCLRLAYLISIVNNICLYVFVIVNNFFNKKFVLFWTTNLFLY